VRDLIDQLAHIEGAVHSGQVRNVRQALVTRVNKEVYFGDLPMGVQQVSRSRGSWFVVFTPLREAVLKSRAALFADTSRPSSSIRHYPEDVLPVGLVLKDLAQLRLGRFARYEEVQRWAIVTA
jgi:hypothetical protein